MGDGPVHVISANAEQMFLDITPAESAGLPRYTGEMELTNHSAGSLTSQAYQKRWIRKEELLADAAEKASVAAEWLGARPYPLARLNDAWTLAMGGHFHDIAAGTATPKSYEFAWNDDVIAMNQFAGVLSDATEAVSAALNTETTGVPLVVFNPLNIAREDLVEADVAFPGGAPSAVHVVGPDGQQAPAQISRGKVLFVARAPSVGYAVYEVRPGAAPAESPSALHVTDSSLENQYYRVTLNTDGDVASIFDKSIGRELLAAPARLGHFLRQSPTVAGLEHGLGPGAGRPKGVRGRTGAHAGGGKWTGPRGHRGCARSRGIQVRPDHQPLGGRRGQARGVRQRGRLEHQRIESEGGFPAGGFQPNGHLQLGHRHHRAAHRGA